LPTKCVIAHLSRTFVVAKGVLLGRVNWLGQACLASIGLEAVATLVYAANAVTSEASPRLQLNIPFSFYRPLCNLCRHYRLHCKLWELLLSLHIRESCCSQRLSLKGHTFLRFGKLCASEQDFVERSDLSSFTMAPPIALDVEVEGLTDTSGVTVPDPISMNGDTHPIFTIDDVLPHRQKSAKMPEGVAPFGSSDMFKSRGCFAKPKAKRWDHRINAESKARQPSSLKGAMKYFKAGVISLGGGLPSSDYFPFERIDIKVPAPPHFSEEETVKTGVAHSAGKHDIPEGKSLFDLSVALNYGQAMGAAQMLRFCTEHTEVCHNPPYSDWECALTGGSTSALEMSFRMFCDPGDYILTEEYTFSTAVETAMPIGLKIAGIKIDAHGLLATDLDHVLSTWDAESRGGPKPFLLYTVPTGQNPTGSTQSLERRKAIYAVAEKHDLYILEDEPYYFLQMEPYVSGTIHTVPTPFKPTTIPTFLANLIPSYLSLDTSGRVLRLDSFSKIIAPGSRAGWLTGCSQIIERYMRHAEVSVQNPAGFSQIILYKLLEEAWGHRGFLEWLMYIRAEYTRRRDIIVNACEAHLPSVASWVPPTAGMFHWISIDASRHPNYDPKDKSFKKLEELEESIFLAAVGKGVLCSRGSWFRAVKGSDTELFFRTTFAAAPADKIVAAIQRFGEALKEEFGIVEGRSNGHVVNGNGNGNGKVNGH
jgi:aromatic amino acid aminotransferase I / 2-aminoadipate transaminase